jgi:hypothetical protein
VLVGSDPKSGKLRFSVSGVDRVLEQNHYRDYREENKQVVASSLGSLGDLLRAKLGLESSPEADSAAPEAHGAAPKAQAAAPAVDAPQRQPTPARPVAAVAAAAPVAKPPPAPSQPSAKDSAPQDMPDGVHRRRR